MKIKTSELIGPALDWAVAKCETASGRDNADTWLRDFRIRFGTRYSSVWSQGGPIIEREGLLLLRPVRKEGHKLNGQWLAMYGASNTGSMVQWTDKFWVPRHYYAGPTP